MSDLAQGQATAGGVCGRAGCGTALLCCRPDCPLVTIQLEPGLQRIMTRRDFVAAMRSEALDRGIDVDAIARRARSDVDSLLLDNGEMR